MKFFFVVYEMEDYSYITKDNAISPAILPHTGLTEKILIVVISLLGLTVIIMYFKCRKYKDIQ